MTTAVEFRKSAFTRSPHFGPAAKATRVDVFDLFLLFREYRLLSLPWYYMTVKTGRWDSWCLLSSSGCTVSDTSRWCLKGKSTPFYSNLRLRSGSKPNTVITLIMLIVSLIYWVSAKCYYKFSKQIFFFQRIKQLATCLKKASQQG